MPATKDIDDMIALVDQSRFIEALERFYADEATMQENAGITRKGLRNLIDHEKGVMAAFPNIRAKTIGPFFISGDYSVVRWVFEFDRPDGKTVTLDELAYQRWEGKKIVEERFYYDPAQMAG